MQSRCNGDIVEHKFLCCQEENVAGIPQDGATVTKKDENLESLIIAQS